MRYWGALAWNNRRLGQGFGARGLDLWCRGKTEKQRSRGKTEVFGRRGQPKPRGGWRDSGAEPPPDLEETWGDHEHPHNRDEIQGGADEISFGLIGEEKLKVKVEHVLQGGGKDGGKRQGETVPIETQKPLGG